MSCPKNEIYHKSNVSASQLCLRLCNPMDSLSMEFSRQEYGRGLPFPSPRDLPDSGIERGFPAWQADSVPHEQPGKPGIYHSQIWTMITVHQSTPGASQGALVVKDSPVNAGNTRDPGSTPGSGRSPGGGLGSPLRCSCLENVTGRGTWGLRFVGSWTAGHDWSVSHTSVQPAQL